ncbi:MAG: thioredoxin family protein, partial [Victivallales bacterium]|nr:thioredoxin family protein [Victivallales bacterium]
LQLAPIIEELRNEYQGVLHVEVVDVGLQENEAMAKNFGVQMIPTLVFLDKDGKELTRNVGYASKEDILKKWRELGHDFLPAAAPEVK